MPRRNRPGQPRRTMTTTQPHCEACRQQIIFIRMVDTGRPLPCDPYPVADGNVSARPSGKGLAGFVITPQRPAAPGSKRYAVHFSTCPQRARPGGARPERPMPHEQLSLFGGDA